MESGRQASTVSRRVLHRTTLQARCQKRTGGQSHAGQVENRCNHFSASEPSKVDIRVTDRAQGGVFPDQGNDDDADAASCPPQMVNRKTGFGES